MSWIRRLSYRKKGTEISKEEGRISNDPFRTSSQPVYPPQVYISELAFVLVYIIERHALKNVEVGNYQMRQSLQVYRNGFIQLIRFSSSLMMALASWTLSWEASG